MIGPSPLFGIMSGSPLECTSWPGWVGGKLWLGISPACPETFTVQSLYNTSCYNHRSLKFGPYITSIASKLKAHYVVTLCAFGLRLYKLNIIINFKVLYYNMDLEITWSCCGFQIFLPWYFTKEL